MAETLDGLQGNQDSTLDANNCISVICQMYMVCMLIFACHMLIVC
jgi:hypothetical protein